MMCSPARFTGRWSAPGGYGGIFPLTSILSHGGERKIRKNFRNSGNLSLCSFTPQQAAGMRVQSFSEALYLGIFEQP
jgi:hypothetical protein